MSIDVYQNCPVHSEKKIKFCCGKDVVTELDHILELFRSKQHAAALDAIAKAESKLGSRDCLLNLKTRILVSQNETEKAEASNNQFLESNPGHMLGMQHQALILTQKDDLAGAVAALQKAADAVGDGNIPFSIINTFRIVGAALVSHGDPIAGRAHLNFFKRFKPDDTQEIDYLIFQAFGGPQVPLPLKAEQPILKCDESEPYYKHNQAINLLTARGRWARAISVGKKALEQFPGEPTLYWNLAVLSSMVARHQDSAEYWNQYSELERVEGWRAIEAKSMAILLNRDWSSGSIDVVQLTWDLNDAEAATEKSLDQSQFESNPISPDAADGPPPKASYVIWDKKPLSDAETSTANDLPVDTGLVAIFGKQTDRSARMELVARSGTELETAKELIKATFGELLTGEPKEEVLGKQAQETPMTEWRVRFPDDMPNRRRQELQQEKASDRIRSIWPNVSYGILENKTLKEAASISDLTLGCQAIVWIMHLSALDDQQVDRTIADICNDLGIELPGDQDINEFKDIVVPISWMHKIDPNECEEPELQNIIQWAMVHRNMACLRRTIPVMLESETLDVNNRVNLLYTYGRVTFDNDEAIKSVQKAREVCSEDVLPKAIWLVRELEIRMERGIEDGISELFQEIQSRASSDEQVADEFARLLLRFGFINEKGEVNPMMVGTNDEGDMEPEMPDGIWTPDKEAEKAGASKKIWVPGDD